MKKIIALFFSLFVVSSVAFAKPAGNVDFATMSKADSQFLFQDGAKVVTLDKAEMKNTEGEFWQIVIWGARAGYSAYRAYKTYRSYNSMRNAYRMGKATWRATSNYRRLNYESGGSGVSWYNRAGQRTFTIDSHRWGGQTRWYQRYHYHRRPGISHHRPWQRW